MKRTSTHVGALFAIVLLSSFAGCGRHRVETSISGRYKDCPRPAWVDHPVCEGGLCAVGVGRSMDYGFSRTKAEADGRDKLAQAIQSDVHNLMERYVEENRMLTTGASSAGFEFATDVSQQLAAIVLHGSRVQAYYDDCVGDSEFAMVILDPGSIVKQLEDSMANAAARTQLFNKASAREAIDRMNRMVEDRYGSGPATARGEGAGE